MTTTETKTRPSENTITRRKMLQSVAATSVATIVPTIFAAAQAAEPVHPWQRARALAKELSSTLAEIDGGRWCAEIYPRNESGYSVFFGDIEALNASKAMSAQEEAELVALGEEYEQVSGANRLLLKEMEPMRARWGEEMDRRKLDWKSQMAEITALEDEVGLGPLQDRNNAYCDRMCEIEKRARELTASTFAGIRAKFIIAHGTLGPAYADEGSRDDQDWDVMLLNEFSDELKQLAAIRA